MVSNRAKHHIFSIFQIALPSLSHSKIEAYKALGINFRKNHCVTWSERRILFHAESFREISGIHPIKNLVGINYRGFVIKYNILSIITTFFWLREKINIPKNLIALNFFAILIYFCTPLNVQEDVQPLN